MHRALIVTALFSAALAAQSLRRFHSYTVEETQFDSGQHHDMRWFNNRGTMGGWNPFTGQAMLRLSNGVLVGFSAGFAPSSLNNHDQMLGDTGSSAAIWDSGTITVCDYFGERHPTGRSGGNHLADSGHFLSTQASYWAGGQPRWVSPQFFVGSVNGTSMFWFAGLPGNLSQYVSSGPYDIEGARPFGPINARNEFLVNVSWWNGTAYEYGLYRSIGSILRPVNLPSGLDPSGINDSSELYGWRVGDGAPFLQRTDGVIEFPAAALQSSIMNRWGERIARRRVPLQSQRPQMALRNGAFAALDVLVGDGLQYSDFGAGGFFQTEGRINDVGQIAVPAVNPSNQARWLLLHPSATPVLALEFFNSYRNRTVHRYEVYREADGRTPVRIVGGEPGQPTAMFLKLGSQYFFVDGTLGFFDKVQTSEFRLPVPPSLVGLDFDVAAASLDAEFGILRSLDQPITFY